MTSKRLGIDMDGVLASFESGFAPILTEIAGINFPLQDPYFPAVWDWPTAYSVTQEEQDKAWQQVMANPDFWRSLDEMPLARLAIRRLEALDHLGHDIYFITHRMGVKAKRQTEDWLIDLGMDCPTVLLVREKHLAAVALKLDYYVDDRWENVRDVRNLTREAGIPTQVVMVERPYNAMHNAEAEAMGIFRTPSLMAMLQETGL